MKTPIIAWLATASLVLGCASVGSSPAASGARGPEALARAMDAIARGEATVSAALASLVDLPSGPNAGRWGDVRLGGFVDPAGYVVWDIEVRVRDGGIDAAPLVVAHLDAAPCADVGALAVMLGANTFAGEPPSPHAPAGTPGTLAWVATHANGGRIAVAASTDHPACASTITAWRPRARTPDATSKGGLGR